MDSDELSARPERVPCRGWGTDAGTTPGGGSRLQQSAFGARRPLLQHRDPRHGLAPGLRQPRQIQPRPQMLRREIEPMPPGSHRAEVLARDHAALDVEQVGPRRRRDRQGELHHEPGASRWIRHRELERGGRIALIDARDPAGAQQRESALVSVQVHGRELVVAARRADIDQAGVGGRSHQIACARGKRIVRAAIEPEVPRRRRGGDPHKERRPTRLRGVGIGERRHGHVCVVSANAMTDPTVSQPAIASNDLTWYGDPQFNYLRSPVGAIVP